MKRVFFTVLSILLLVAGCGVKETNTTQPPKEFTASVKPKAVSKDTTKEVEEVKPEVKEEVKEEEAIPVPEPQPQQQAPQPPPPAVSGLNNNDVRNVLMQLVTVSHLLVDHFNIGHQNQTERPPFSEIENAVRQYASTNMTQVAKLIYEDPQMCSACDTTPFFYADELGDISISSDTPTQINGHVDMYDIYGQRQYIATLPFTLIKENNVWKVHSFGNY